MNLNHESQEVLSEHDRLLEAQEKIAELSAEKERLQKEIEKLSWDLRTSLAKAEDQRRAAQYQQKGLEEKLSVQLATIKKRDERIEGLLEEYKALEAKENAQVAALRELERRIREETAHRVKLDEMLRAALKYLTKLGKWSDRLLQEYKKVLNSNRWRIGCWLSFKRADEKSKEGQLLAKLIASRLALARRVESLIDKAKPNEVTGTPDLATGSNEFPKAA
jgi:chromosome segregation ATPase